ncbi:hypothetical protein BH11VER1_BH11VER1_15460 [soil metagenome]
MKLIVFSLFLIFGGIANAQQIEVSPHRKPYTRDATVGYTSTESETKFDAKKADADVGGDSGFNAKTPGSLLGKRGKLVSWFGIVRELPAKAGDSFLIEHKHFDGLNDYHIQLASLYGVGDFRVVAADTAGVVKRLSLVRVIGTVAEEAGGVPTMKADYIRVWHLGDFAFMDYGADSTNERWMKLRQKVDLIYDPEPNDAYYEMLLGK